VTYDDTSHNPNTASRTISFEANDGMLNSVVSTKTVSITAVNTPPSDIIWNAVGGSSLPGTGTIATLSTIDSNDSSGFTYSLVTSSDVNSPNFTVSSDGTVTRTGSALATDTTYTLAIQSTDPHGAAFQEVFHIITGDNSGNTLTGTPGPNIIYGLGGNDTITGGAGDDVLIGGSGADTMTGGGGNDTFIFGSGDSPGTIGGSGNSGTVTGFDVITDFNTTNDVLDLVGTPAAVANTTGTNGTDSTLTISSSTVKSHAITNGIITFSNSDTFGTALSLTSTANVAAVVQYLQNNSFGSDGTVAFTATISGTAHSYIYEQLSAGVPGTSSSNSLLVDLQGVPLTNLTSLIPSHVAPAGTSGAPINLALTDPSGVGALTTVTISGMPADWRLNEGTNLGNGTWAVATEDLSALTVLTAAAYAGAMVLGVTETWANADGSIGTAFVSDNVEAYAPGSPIFAMSGDDTLTGAGANDLFVFAQPIGNDTIYNFNVATDKIDLTGFAGIASFGDIAGHIADDGHGDAVITLGNGETIALHGVNAASLTADDFVFNQTPVVENAGNMVVSDGAMLPLNGTIDNTGTIALDSSGGATELQIIGDGITLQGGGQLTMSGDAVIVGTTSASTLTNVDNTISGAGQIGSGDGNLTLVNAAHGTIDANIFGGTLTLNTGHTITNDGILEATNGGTLQIDNAVSGGGSAIIAGGTLIFDALSNMNVTFDNGIGTPAYGELVLGQASDFSGQISGFTGTAPDTAHSDAIDLKDISFGSNITFAYDDNSGTDTGGTLTVFDSGNTVGSIAFANGDYDTASFNLSSDGSGGTLITDPPTSTTPTAGATTSSSHSAATLIGGSNGNNTVTGSDILIGGGPANQSLTGNGNNDSFVFAPGFSHDTITNFQPTTDVLQIDHSLFANVQALFAATQDDGHGNVVITADAHNSITLQHVTVAQLQAHQGDFHII
jgi:Ca2+-binding RTX toxin-like protein